MRRLPIYFLVDVSESMVGTPIEQVQDGMATIINELRTDPYALETAWVSVIAFAGKAKMLSPLQELYKFYPPKFPIGGGTSLGKALNFLMDEMDSSLQKTTAEVKGDWKPIIFLFTDGNPTDSVDKAFERWNNKYRRHCNLIIVSIGDNVNTMFFISVIFLYILQFYFDFSLLFCRFNVAKIHFFSDLLQKHCVIVLWH